MTTMAFPDPGRGQSEKQRKVLTQTGMTLRDYFAAKAMQGIAANSRWNVSGQVKNCVREAYEIADAMMEARK